MLQGLNKRETAEKYGDEQVHVWRRSYDVAPRLWPRTIRAIRASIPVTQGFPMPNCPAPSRSATPWPARCPIGSARYSPALARYDQVLVVAHGNSLRGIIKNLKGISDEAISEFNLPTAVPYVFEFDEGLGYVKDYFLGDPPRSPN